MKNLPVLAFAFLAAVAARSQYYYKDIVGTKDINQLIATYQVNKVLSVEATGTDGDGRKNSDFSETHNFYATRNTLKISGRNKTEINNEYYRFDAKGMVTTVSDTINSAISTTTYSFDENGNPVTISNTVADPTDSINSAEVHQWFYNEQGKPVRMLRIVNRNDTTDVRFTIDAQGNVVEELPFVKKVSREKTYYYYDSQNRMTDIVRFNIKANRLLPDFMFEYSETGQVIQKITTTSALGIGYIIWRYVYNDKGLKTTEASFNKDKVLTGKIQYAYQFAQ